MPSNAVCGKIKYCMDTNNIIEKEYPPRIHTAFVKGFNTIANHAYLLLLPFLLDIFFWLGPNFSVSNTLTRIFNASFSQIEVEFQNQLPQSGIPEAAQMFESYRTAYLEFAGSFNLFSFISTGPIGVPSLLSFGIIKDNPLGLINKISVPSLSQEFLVIVALFIIGSFIGGIYFSEIGRRSNLNPDQAAFSFSAFLKNIGWMILINFILLLVLALIIIPFTILFFSMIIAIAAALNIPVIFNIAIFIYLLVLFWVFIPLIYTPHGVIIQQQDLFNAMLCSRRLVRYYMPGTGFFIMFSVLIYQLLNQYLWSMPQSSSYMLAGGIFGHAFICTGLIASSFIYYQDGVKWMKHNLKMIAQQSNQTSRPFQA
jgi:hypothetical protein